jgi:plastocyanin
MRFIQLKTPRWALVLVLFVLTLASACSSSSSNDNPPAPAEGSSAGTAPATAASDAGPHTISGRLPAAIGGFPSIVILEAQAPAGDAAPSSSPYMDQIQQTFLPPVLMVRTGQPVEFRNSDEVLHNVRVREDATHSPAFNVAIPTGETYMFTFPRDGFYDVGCDIHPGMAAQIVSTQSPYTAVADPDGVYAIPGVPNGSYKAIVYSGSQKIERDLTVAGNQTRFDVAQ